MADVEITLKRNNSGTADRLLPTTSWNQVESKPSTFTPSAHTHPSSDITDLKEQLKYLYIYGKAQSAITKGQAVQFAGVQGDHILMKPAVPSEINANPDYFMGIAEATLATNDFGYVLTQGELVGVNTSTYSEGAILWFASAGGTNGALTATEPTNSNSRIQVAAVNKVNASSGIIFVRIHLIGTEIEDIVASGTASSTTFLRGDGQWAVPATQAHTHTLADITDSNTLVTLADSQTISGAKSFSSTIYVNGGLNSDGGSITANVDSFNVGGSVNGDALGVEPLSPANTTSDSGNLNFRYRSASTTVTRVLKVNSAGTLLYNGVEVPTGTGTANQIAYYTGSTSLASLSTATYPSLTELSYVKGVTSAIQTQINGKAATSHTHPFTAITGTATTAQLPTITVAKGGTGQTSYTNVGGVMYYNSQSGIISAGGAASQNAVLQATGYNGTHYFGNWVTLSTFTASLESTTTIATLAANTLSSSYSVSGYRFAHIWLSNTAANTTTTIWQGTIDLDDTNQRGTTTGNQRYQRIVWNNGTTTFADNLEIYSASSTSIQFRHSAGITMRYRIVWEV